MQIYPLILKEHFAKYLQGIFILTLSMLISSVKCQSAEEEFAHQLFDVFHNRDTTLLRELSLSKADYCRILHWDCSDNDTTANEMIALLNSANTEQLWKIDSNFNSHGVNLKNAIYKNFEIEYGGFVSICRIYFTIDTAAYWIECEYIKMNGGYLISSIAADSFNEKGYYPLLREYEKTMEEMNKDDN